VTQALVTLDLAREVGIQRIVYFSVFNSALFDDVPHFASKYLAERVIDAQALPATVLRPAAFMQNDLMLRDALKAGVYPQPIGGVGLAMVDTRDIAEAAAVELLRRERAPHPLPRTTIELVGPDTLTGADVAAIWASVLGRQVRYGGDELAGARFPRDAAGYAALRHGSGQGQPRDIRGPARPSAADLPRIRGGGRCELVSEAWSRWKRAGLLRRGVDRAEGAARRGDLSAQRQTSETRRLARRLTIGRQKPRVDGRQGRREHQRRDA
jgi:NmrA-like family